MSTRRMWLKINEQYSIKSSPTERGVNVAFYSDSNMTHGDLCSAKYRSVVNCFVLCYHGFRKEFKSQGLKVLEFISFTIQ